MIQVFKPCIGMEEVEAVKEVLLSGWLGLGPKTTEFEKKFSEYISVKQTVGLNSCTAALEMALKLLGVGSGDEVILPTMTFISTGHAVVYNRAKPVFADVECDTLGISAEDIARKITKKTKAIMVVHYGGRPVDIDAIKQVANGIPIIEDCAHACGAEYKGKKCGSLADIGCFSFQAVKNLCMGDGGAITCEDEAMVARAKKLRWLGIDKGTWDRTSGDKSYWWEYNVDEVGYKNHMNDIMAAIGIEQLKKLDAMNQRRREVAEQYTERLQNIPQITTPLANNKTFKSSWHIYHIQCENRNELASHLQSKDICTGVHYTPNHTYKCYHDSAKLPTAESVFPRLLSLPMYPDLKNKDVEYVISEIENFYKIK